MKKTLSLGMIMAGVFLISASAAFAQDAIQLPTSVRPLNASVIREKMLDTRVQRDDIKNTIKNVQENFKTQTSVLRQDTKEKIKEASSSPERREILKNAVDARKDIVEDRRASTTVIKNQLRTLVRQHVGVIIQRFSIALKQFDNLTNRIQSRIDKLKAGGIDTSSADAVFATAKNAVLQAKADVQALSDLVAQVNEASDAKTVRTQVETAVKKATVSIKAAHDALEAVAKDLVALVRSQNKNPRATSTVENNQ